ncbi:DNA-binding PucR family transcriptional regulator [Sinomonas atrocyanea]|uniref:PucR family transcriptional regulator n=1 Tax=Sinomonas atrocyanea TaxID=37927 RepID=UPI00278232C5|nr:helix-turn-helix domain-containing protein [Sinomonas atrocyanea]MDP9884220.1 DNA-binding PucR family transcriptional regulator [Sinomonas atrocyanea]
MVSQSRLPYAPDVDALTDRAVALMWAVYPGYSPDRLEKSELVPSVRSNIELAIEVVRRDQPPSYRELAHARSLGVRRASQSVPLESVIQAYRSTERVIILDLFSDARSWPADQANHYADLVITIFDLLTDEMINSYRETSTAIDAARQRVENELVGSVASGLPVERDQIAGWARILGISPSWPWFAVALLAETADEPAQLDLQRLRRRLAAKLKPLASALLFGDVGTMTVGLISPHGGADRAVEALSAAIASFDGDSRVVCGVGEEVAGLDRAGESCRQAADSARAAVVRGDGASVVEYRNALLEVIISGRPAAADALVASRIAPLFPYPHLLETLETLLYEDLSQSRTARRMFVHVNTVGHRVRKIAELTGHDPTRTPDIIEMALALRWAQLTGAVRAHRGPSPSAQPPK